MPRLWAIGRTGGTSTRRFGYFDLPSWDFTDLTPHPYHYVYCLLVFAEDDVWAGFGSEYMTDKPIIGHFDGNSWTIYEVSGCPSYYTYEVRSLAVTPGGTIYAASRHPSTCGRGRISRWSGSAWAAVFANWNGLSVNLFANSDTEIWVAQGNCSGYPHSQCQLWDGASLVEAADVYGGGSANGIGVRSDGVAFATHYQSGNMYRRTGAATWAVEVDLGGNCWSEDGPALWVDPRTDSIWALSRNETLTEWRVNTYTIDSALTYQAVNNVGNPGRIHGLSADPAPWIVNSARGGTRVNDYNPLTDTWTLYRDSGLHLDGIAFETVLPAPPYLDGRIPAADSVGNAPDTSIIYEVRDINENLDDATVQAWVNNTLAWQGGRVLPGFVVSAAAVAGPAGVGYVVQPAALLEPGETTVRVRAEDTLGALLDETYAFEVADIVITEDTIAGDASQQDTAGIDLYLDTSHDLEVQSYDLRMVAGADEVAQHLLVGLRLFLGEWYLDEQAGMPYYRDAFVAAPSTRVLEILFRQEILADPDIEQIKEFTMRHDRATRSLDVAFVAVSSVGVVDVEAVFP